MKLNDSNQEPKGLSMIQKIGIVILVLIIILYYVLSIQYLASLDLQR